MTPNEAIEAIRTDDQRRADEANDLLNALFLRDWVMRVLDAWADAHETDGFVELARHMGDGSSWAITCKRASCRSDPYALSVNDPSYYDDGFRCWWFEADSAEAARLAAAEAVFGELPESVRAELGEKP